MVFRRTKVIIWYHFKIILKRIYNEFETIFRRAFVLNLRWFSDILKIYLILYFNKIEKLVCYKLPDDNFSELENLKILSYALHWKKNLVKSNKFYLVLVNDFLPIYLDNIYLNLNTVL